MRRIHKRKKVKKEEKRGRDMISFFTFMVTKGTHKGQMKRQQIY